MGTFRIRACVLSLWLACVLGASASHAQGPAPGADLSGTWIVNEELSDDTDRQVEKAIREAGGRPDSGGKRGKGRYRGGPPEQAIYDHISYDDVLVIHQSDPQFRFSYPGGFEREFYTDGRSRTVSASGAHEDRGDFSFASWQGAALFVESRPRDGGRMTEIYTLQAEGARLRLEATIEPLTFPGTVSLVRYYDRQGSAAAKAE